MRRGSVRITRFRRNRSLPAMTTSHLWVCIVSALLVPTSFSFSLTEVEIDQSRKEGRSASAGWRLVDRDRWGSRAVVAVLRRAMVEVSGGKGQTRIGRAWLGPSCALCIS